MAIRHSEEIAKIEAVRTVPDGDAFTFEIDVTTGGGVRKTLRLAHYDASFLASSIVSEVDAMEPEVRKRSFFASMQRAR